jgi:hypothetical protein
LKVLVNSTQEKLEKEVASVYAVNLEDSIT